MGILTTPSAITPGAAKRERRAAFVEIAMIALFILVVFLLVGGMIGGGYLLQSTHADRVLPGDAKMKRKSELNGRNSAAAQSDRLTPHVDGTMLTRRVPSLHLLGLSA